MKKIFLSLICGILLLGLAGCGTGVKVVKSHTSKVSYENYNNGLISLKIPKGWKVEVAPADYIHYSFKVYNPENKNYMLLFGLKQEGFLKNEGSKKYLC